MERVEPWGKAVGGLALRLTAPRRLFQGGERIALIAEARNGADATVFAPEDETGYTLFIDGKQYRYKAGTCQLADPPVCYGRVPFEDGTTPRFDPDTSSGTKITVGGPGLTTGQGTLDDQGYFLLYMPASRTEQLKAKNRPLPIYEGSLAQVNGGMTTMSASAVRRIGDFPLELLSADRDKAGVVKIPKPAGTRP